MLEVNDLTVRFRRNGSTVHAVNGLSFRIGDRERLAIVGESGCGKTVTCLSILGLNPSAEVRGSIVFDGKNTLQLPESEMRSLRGRHIAMVFQDPSSALNPVTTIGKQMIEVIRHHHAVSSHEAQRRAIGALREMSVPSPEAKLDEYPHQQSGGTNQRIMLAMALTCDPDLLIADEPTASLDATVQQQIIRLLIRICEDRGMSILCVTHNLALVRRIADRVLVLYHGMLMEEGPVDQILHQPRHPYTKALLSAFRLDSSNQVVVEGEPPSPLHVAPGCPYSARCQERIGEVCDRQLPRIIDSGGKVRCHLFDDEIVGNGV
jgi:peptide/nickel transport system ATP-binding protein